MNDLTLFTPEEKVMTTKELAKTFRLFRSTSEKYWRKTYKSF